MAEVEQDSYNPFEELSNRNLAGPRGYERLDRLEFLPALRGRHAAEVYREMADNDALIGAILFAIEMVIRRVEWEVEPGRSGPDGETTPEDVERADFLSSCAFEDMSTTWEEFIADALTMLPHGYAYMEIVYKRRDDATLEASAEERTRYPDGKIGWRKFVLVPQQTIEDFLVDDHGGVQAAIQGGSYGTARVQIPIEKAMLFRTSQRSPRGKSILRRVVESWYFRKRIKEVEGIGIERDLAGLPVFTLAAEIAADATKKLEYENIVRNLRRDEQEGVIVPGKLDDKGELKPMAKLELLSTGGSRQFDTNTIVNRYSREIAIAVLQDLVLLGHEKVGTQALASEKRDLSDTALQAWLNTLETVLNLHAVPRLFALNGETLENLPQLKSNDIHPADVEEFFSALKQASDAGFAFTDDMDVEAEVRRRLGIPPLTPEKIKEREAELEEERKREEELLRNPPPPPPVPPAPNGNQPPRQEPQPQANE